MQVFGIDVEAFTREPAAHVDRGVFGYPLASLAELPAGDYLVQALNAVGGVGPLGSGATGSERINLDPSACDLAGAAQQ